MTTTLDVIQRAKRYVMGVRRDPMTTVATSEIDNDDATLIVASASTAGIADPQMRAWADAFAAAWAVRNGGAETNQERFVRVASLLNDMTGKVVMTGSGDRKSVV